jgi:AcrR family transcriptional regulator
VAEALADVQTDAVRGLVKGLPALGLRERKRMAAMRRIQHVAVEQFEQHGFANVTVEHIAAHAEVSPSSVYRYFGTKEGLVLRDEFDDQLLDAAARLFASSDPWTAIARAIEAIAPLHLLFDDLSRRRMKIWYETPAVRAAGFVVLDETAKRLAPEMHAADRHGLTPEHYEIISASLLGAVFACLERWYLDGGQRDLAQELTDAVELLRPSWATDPSATVPR